MKDLLTLTPIQIALFFLVIGLIITSLRVFRNKVLYRILFLGVLTTGIIFVLFPVLTDLLATWLNVGRGVDLVFYILFTAFFFVIIILYRRMLSFEEVITKIVRKNAITNATKKA